MNESHQFQVYAIDHVQLSMPPGEEERARAFYVGLLGFTEVAKPEALAGRGGAWFESGSAKLHLGAEPGMPAGGPAHPVKKAHPALLVHGLTELVARLQAAGVTVGFDVPLPGYDRAHIVDPFGNRIELLEVTG
jgi:catechol 2,3-dioxygenase-like lactoylglutathione lyase family enzyme